MRPEYPRGINATCDIKYHEQIDGRDVLIVNHFGNNVTVYMRSRTGPWTVVQSFSRSRANSSIGKSSNFSLPIVAMEVFLAACQEAS